MNKYETNKKTNQLSGFYMKETLIVNAFSRERTET